MTQQLPQYEWSEQWLTRLGEMTAHAWVLRHCLNELGRAWGVRLKLTHYIGAVAELRSCLGDEGVPAWFSPEYSVETTRKWLDDVSDLLRSHDQIVAAISAHPGEPKRVEVNKQAVVTLTADEIAHLIGRLRSASEQGDQILSQTSMKLAAGASQFGYRDIARSLYITMVSGARDTTPVAR